MSVSSLRRLSAPSLQSGHEASPLGHPSTEVFESWHRDWGHIAQIRRQYGRSSAFISASINREKFLIVSIDAETTFGKV